MSSPILILPGPGRFVYAAVAGASDFDWPGGRRLTLFFVIKPEHFAFGEGLGAELAPGGPQPDVLNRARREVRSRVGAWRLLAAVRPAGVAGDGAGQFGDGSACPGADGRPSRAGR